MKYCKNCGSELPDTAKFCGKCGKIFELLDENNIYNPVIDQEKKKKVKFEKNYFIIGTVSIVLIAILVVAWFGFKDNKQVKEYEQYMTMAAKYVEELDYEQAADAYLKAIEIEPKEREAYIKLAEVYLEQEEYHKAKDILEKAEEIETEQTQEQEEKEKELREKIKKQEEKIYSWVVEPTIEADDIFYLADYPGDVSLNELYKQAGDTRAVIQREDQYGIIDMSGKILADVEYKEMASFGESYLMRRTTPVYEQEYEQDWDIYWLTQEDDILANVGNGDLCLWFYYYYEGNRQLAGHLYGKSVKEAIPVRNSKVYTTSEEDRKEIWDNLSGKYAIDNNGTLVTDFIYDECGSVSEGLLAVCKNGKWGYVDENGKTIIPIEYDASWEHYPVFDNGASRSTDNVMDYCYAASDGYVVLRKNDEWELRDTGGKTVIKSGIFEAIRPVFDGKCWVKKNGKWGIIELANAKSKKLDTELSEQEIFEKLKEALAISQMCRGVPTAKYLDTDDVVYSDYSMATNWPYYCVTYPNVGSYQDLIELVQQYYTTEVSSNLEREYYIEKDGKLYLPSADGLGGPGVEKRRIQITKYEENTYHIVEIDVYNITGMEDLYSEFNYICEDSKWVFDTEIWNIDVYDMYVLEESSTSR